MLALAAAVERESEHPLAQAVALHADAAGVPRLAATAFRNVPGHGAQGQVDGRRSQGLASPASRFTSIADDEYQSNALQWGK
jgi:cation transport ATPase